MKLDKWQGAMALGLLGSLSIACAGTTDDSGTDTAAVTSNGSVCSPEAQAAATKRMLESPIRPRSSIGGVDFSGPDFTIADVERTHCQAADLSETEDSFIAGWGLQDGYSSVEFEADKATGTIEWFMLKNGYKGTLDFVSRPSAIDDPSKPNPFGQHTYSVGVGRRVLRDGQPWALNWNRACDPGVTDCWDAQSTELFDALMYTFAPTKPSTQTSCIGERSCLAMALPEGEGIFGVRPLGIYFVVPEAAVSNTVWYFYGFKDEIVLPPAEPTERTTGSARSRATVLR